MAEQEDDAFDADLLSRIGGTRLEVGGHRPFRLSDADAVWLVLTGQVDVFAVEFEGDEPVGQRRHLARFGSGEVLFGTGFLPLPEPGRQLELLAVAAMGTALFQGSRTRVASSEFDLVVVSWIDGWVASLSDTIGRILPVPRAAQLIEAEPDVAVGDGTWLSAQHLDVIWIEPTAGTLLVEGDAAMPIGPGMPLLPVTERSCVRMSGDGAVTGRYTPTVLFQRRLWTGLDMFHGVVLQCASAMELREREADRIALERRRATRVEKLDTALGALAGILEKRPAAPPPRIDAGREIHTVVQIVARELGIPFDVEAPADISAETRTDPLQALVRRAGLVSRRVVLSEDWWRSDSGPLVAWTSDDSRPVVLIPHGVGSYVCVDPRLGTIRPVDRALSDSLTGQAQMIYRPLPDGTAGAGALLRFGAFRLGRDLRAILLLAILSGLLALAVPLVTGRLLVEVLPFARMDSVAFLLTALGIAALGTAAFDVVRAIALLRIEGRMDLSIQAAVWDRLLALPTQFFRRYTAGDLADRANGISAIRQILTASVASAVMGMVSASFSFLLLFWYSWRLALIACGLMVILGGATVLFGWMQMPHHRALFRMQGRLDGLVFQLLSGIAKLRVANSEALGLARWAEGFAEQKYHTLQVRWWAAAQQVFNAIFPVLASLGLFAFIYYGLYEAKYQTGFDLAAFLSFNAAFGQFMGATVALTGSLTTVLAVVPLYERVAPVLEESREATSTKVDPGELRGDIELRRVSFRYQPTGPLVLDDVSFRIATGEYVAFVGPSGSGKSTIYRLLLGFEQPAGGSVLLDGHDLDSLDLGAVRGQMGVVLQNGRLLAGSIFENIVGSLPLTQEDAWEAARRAGFDRDVRSMPMGMHTVLPEGGIGLSGGQKQRLLIARALVRRPRILLFDEATSALDNQTQSIVQASLERLTVTRVVIAHRLSTIRGVDRIYVVDGGRIVETGTYDELMERDGAFARLAKRQIL